MKPVKTPFFVGYLPVPKKLRPFLLLASFALVILFAAAGYLVGATQDDPGTGAFRFDLGRQTVTGVIELKPYPLLHVTQGTDAIPAGRTLMLTGSGKQGVMDRAAPLDGQLATASGIILRRGELDMLQMRGGKQGLAPAEGDTPVISTLELGRWRLEGEICDGKCLAGAMRPGRGLAHKACANLCLIGGIPPVFVSAAPVEGSEFMLIGRKGGGALTDEDNNFVGQYIGLEGDLQRRGDMLVFLMDPESIGVLP